MDLLVFFARCICCFNLGQFEFGFVFFKIQDFPHKLEFLLKGVVQHLELAVGIEAQH